MATVEQLLTEEWVDVSTALSLSSGTLYNIQVLGNGVRVAESPTMPTVEGRYYTPGYEFPYSQGNTDNLWAKGAFDVSILVVDEG